MMKINKRIPPITYFSLLILSLLSTQLTQAQKYDAVYSGVPWMDDLGKPVSAHGANIIQENGVFYLFGEAHSDTSNAFEGFNCYSSKDLCNWTFRSVALAKQPTGKLGPNRVGERPKVMKCPATGEYVLFMHVDSTNYKNQFVGYATSKKITGPYDFKGPLLMNGHPIKKWDMGTFQDLDGKGYILLHGGDIYELNSDYTSIKAQVNKAMTSGFESPTLFRKDSLYYFMGSNLTSWEKNDNYYFTSTSLKGPWKRAGLFAPKGTLTWNSQSTFVLPIYGSKDTSFIYMGDRWSYPKQASAATYVWQPIKIKGESLIIPQFHEAWKVDLRTGTVTDLLPPSTVIHPHNPNIQYTGAWQKSLVGGVASNQKALNFAIHLLGAK